MNFLRDWQTLISALLALVAAWLTIRTMKAQMREDTSRFKNARVRKKLAVRARLPDALSHFVDHVKDSCILAIGPHNEAPVVPSLELNTFYDAIEHVDDDAAARLFELVSWYQVWRVRAFSRDVRNTVSFRQQVIYDTSLLVAYAYSLFDYARNETQKVSVDAPTSEEMLTALRVIFGWDEMKELKHQNLIEGVKATIIRRHGDPDPAYL